MVSTSIASVFQRFGFPVPGPDPVQVLPNLQVKSSVQKQIETIDDQPVRPGIDIHHRCWLITSRRKP